MAKKKATKEQLEAHIVNMVAFKQVITDYIKDCRAKLKAGPIAYTEPPNPPKTPPFP